jgi:SAM-dependent methyltransferase
MALIDNRALGEPGVVCPACGGALAPWRTVPAAEPGLEGRYQLLRCTVCGTAVTVGGPSDHDLHETGAYRPGQPRLYRLARPLLDLFDRQRLALLRSLIEPPARLLDVGAGRGRFVAAAGAAGYEASGIEPSLRGWGAASARGVGVRQASIEDAPFAEDSFDAVTAWHVLEHLDDPGAALTRVSSWLRPGGVLLVGAPNLASAQARVAAGRWYHLDAPRHRVHFTPGGLEALLRAHGFTPVRTVHALLEHNPFGMWQSLVNRVTRDPSYLYNLLKRNAPLRSPDLLITVAALPLAPFAAFAELVAALARRGGTIAVLARRVA